ncbi:MAG: carboxypeptidase regulatory-like domain-containing protein [Vicinamibacterales bacterium]
MAFALLTCAGTASAQTPTTGALVGTVTDSSGAVLPGVTVTVTNVATGTMRTTATDDGAVYRVPLLPPARYRIEFTLSGFKTQVQDNVTISVTETHTVNATLEVGAQEETITVVGQAALVQTESSTLGRVVDAATITNLPLTTRNYTQVLGLSAGVAADVTNAGELGKNTQDVYVNGMRNTDNNFQMDGASINNLHTGRAGDWLAASGIAIPNPDTIQEFKVQTTLYDAAFGRNAGANVNVITKSGTNDYRGSLFEFFRNEALNANDFFLKQNAQPKPILRQNQFGGTLGGRVVRDRLFFFTSYQGTRQTNGIGAKSLASRFLPPLTDDRSRAALGAQFGGQQGDNGGVAVAFDGSNINPVALALLNSRLPDNSLLIPTPQVIQPNGLGFSVFSDPSEFIEDQILINLDNVISTAHSLSLRAFYSDGLQRESFADCNCTPGTGVDKDFTNTNVIVKLSSVLSDTLMNEVRFSVTQNYGLATGRTPFSARDFGIVPSFTHPVMPTVSVAGLFSLGGNFNDDWLQDATQYQAAQQISWVRGRHYVRAGFEFERGHNNFDINGLTRGSLSFRSFPDFLLGLSGADNGTAFSNVFSSFSIAGPMDRKFRTNNLSSFVQDDFKVHPRLTLNLGLRWEALGNVSDADGRLPNFWPDLILASGPPPAEGTYAGFTVAANHPADQYPIPEGVLRRDGKTAGRVGVPLNNWGPRIGFALKPLARTERLVLRGGYGIFYSRTTGQHVLRQAIEPPFASSFTLSAQANRAATFQVPFNPGPTPGVWPLRTPTSVLSHTSVAEDFASPRTQQYSVNVQYEFAPEFLLELAYVGTRGTKTSRTRQVNQPMLANPSNPVNGLTTNTVANALQRVPYLGFSRLQLIESYGFSTHNALHTTVRKRFSGGLQFQASHTWGKTLTDTLGQGSSATFQGGTGNYNDVNDWRQRWGPTDYDRRHRFVFNFAWALPDFAQSEGFVGTLLSGWQVAGVGTVQSGQSLTLTDSRGGSIYAFNSASAPTLCPGSTHADIPTQGSVTERLDNFFNRAAFCAPPPLGNGTGFGTLGRGVVRGPDQRNLDLAISKLTRVGGLHPDGMLEFRAELFNALNTPQFANPGLNVAQANFGRISATAVAPRLVQLALKYMF